MVMDLVGGKFQRVPIGGRRRADLLDETRWSNDFIYEDMEVLANHMELCQVDKGAVIFEQGSRELFMCIIKEGEVEVHKEDSKQKTKVLATIAKDKTLGEMALIDNQPRSASAIAKTRVVMFVLTKDKFDAMADSYPKVWGALLLKLCRLMSQRLRETSGVLVDYLGR